MLCPRGPGLASLDPGGVGCGVTYGLGLGGPEPVRCGGVDAGGDVEGGCVPCAEALLWRWVGERTGVLGLLAGPGLCAMRALLGYCAEAARGDHGAVPWRKVSRGEGRGGQDERREQASELVGVGVEHALGLIGDGRAVGEHRQLPRRGHGRMVHKRAAVVLRRAHDAR